MSNLNKILVFVAVVLSVNPENTVFVAAGYFREYDIPEPKFANKYYCQEDLIYRPYLKIYSGRREAMKTGLPDKILGPGFHPEFLSSKMENVYICVNGLAWLYYSITTKTTTVFQTPRLHTFVHHCFMGNGIPGPGPHEEFKKLLAILLVGNPKDYRDPSAQLFPAPYKASKDAPEYNATSVFVIGEDSECILTKGINLDTEFRVRNDNNAGTAKTVADVRKHNGSTVFCKLSYQNLGGNLVGSSDVARELLKNDAPIGVKGCWIPAVYNEQFVEYVDKQITAFNAIKSGTGKIGKLYAEIKDVKKYLGDKDVDTSIITLSSDPCASASRCTVQAIQADVNKAPIRGTTGATYEKNRKDRTSAMLRNYESRIYKIQDALKKGIDAAVAAYGTAKTSITAATGTAGNALTSAIKTKQTAVTAAQNKVNQEKQTGKVSPGTLQALTKAEDELITAQENFNVKLKKAQLDLSVAETANQTVRALLNTGFAKQEYDDFAKLYKKVYGGGKVPFVPIGAEPIPASTTLTIKRAASDAAELGPDPKELDKTTIDKDPSSAKTCGRIQKPSDICRFSTPSRVRSCQILKAKMNRFPRGVGDWRPQDDWVQDLLDLIGEIYVQMVPTGTITNVEGFYKSLTYVIKGYLTNFIEGTVEVPTTKKGRRKRSTSQEEDNSLELKWDLKDQPLEDPIRTQRQDPADPAAAAPDPAAAPDDATAPDSSASPDAPPDPEPAAAEPDPNDPDDLANDDTLSGRAGATATASGKVPLNPRRSFYDQIMVALEKCRDKKIILHFDTSQGREKLLLVRRYQKLVVEENFEQADEEYSFNFVVDNLWMVFTSVLGVCMPSFEMAIPLISAKFYTHYSEDIFYPLAKEWVNPRDNIVLRLLFGEWYKSPWPKRIMEASFVYAGDLKYRPPRKLYVNDVSEGNFFTEGPLKGTAGIYNA